MGSIGGIEYKGSENNQFKLIAKTVYGLEEVLAKEIEQLGGQNIEILQRAVMFTGTMEIVYKTNYCCRTALSILKPIVEFQAQNEQELYKKVSEIKWEQILDVDGSFLIESTLNSRFFSHSLYIAQKTKDAIVDRFRKMFNRRPTIRMENPDFRINIHIYDDKVTLSLNSSGDSLHKRGYRVETAIAPINEVLAAGLIQLSGWRRDTNFIDPMCGAGTILIEAAMFANSIPAQYYRKSFGFKKWKEYNVAEWKRIKEAADSQMQEFDFLIWGSDIDKKALEIARKNLAFAKLHKEVELFHASIENQMPPEGECMVIMNPPYGERINPEDLNALYTKMGNTFKHNYGEGKTVWVISSDFTALKHIGLKTSKKIVLYNGQLECRFMRYDMYSGSKKGSKFVEHPA